MMTNAMLRGRYQYTHCVRLPLLRRQRPWFYDEFVLDHVYAGAVLHS